MKSTSKNGRLLVASSLLLACVGAYAATGYTVKPMQEAAVQPGMNMEEVQQALGKPSLQEKFRNEPGPTWTYNVAGIYETPKVFEIDFSTDGRVISASERVLPQYSKGNH